MRIGCKMFIFADFCDDLTLELGGDDFDGLFAFTPNTVELYLIMTRDRINVNHFD